MNNNKPSFIKIVLSALSAAFGVQNRKNLENDFQQSSPLPFIVAGVLLTALFVASLVTLVHFVLKFAS